MVGMVVGLKISFEKASERKRKKEGRSEKGGCLAVIHTLFCAARVCERGSVPSSNFQQKLRRFAESKFAPSFVHTVRSLFLR